jgi:pimeloyl-ACP methyl ester carboxylesterase
VLAATTGGGPGSTPPDPDALATHLGGGLEDQMIPPANQRRLAAGIKGAKLVLYPGAAHGFLAQDWRNFGARVERFFG